MSLQVWLPLNGNLNNQGLSDITVTNNGATVDNNGKIGKCYSFNNDTSYISLTSTSINNCFKGGNNPFSIAFWILHADTSRAIIFGDYSLTGAINFNLELSSGHALRFYWNGAPDTYFTTILATNVWQHIVVTYDGIKLRYYLNGELKDTQTYTLTTKSKTNGEWRLGRDARTGTTTLNGKINDFRIYDHCISAKEVKELAKGLILHYKLAGIGGKNLLNGSVHLASVWTQDGLAVSNHSDSQYSGIKLFSNSANGRVYNSVSNVWLTNGAEYSVSFMAKSDTAGTSIDMSRSLADFSQTFTLTTDWKYYTGTIKITNTSTGGTLSIRVNQASRNAYIANLKLENGTISTPYCPPVNSTLYTTLGYNDGIEYDCSGYGNDGIKNGTINTDTITSRYEVANTFPNGTDYIKSSFTKSMDEFSFSYWIKPSSSNGAYAIVASNFGNDAQCWFAINTENCGVWFYTGQYAKVSGLLTNNVWHHCVFTFKNGICKWYVNGIEKTLSTNTVTKTSIPFNNFTIANSYNGTTWNCKNYSSLSDVRIYSTALSAEDIKELYQTSASIDKNGNMYCYGLVEE